MRDSLTAEQELAYDSIAFAYNTIVSGLGAHATDYSSSRGKALSGGDNGAATMANYWDWRDLCRKSYVSARLAIDVIIFGRPLNEIDREIKMANGSAKENLCKCL
ncbi:MAG: hypothetical protein V4493_01480, partial [Pseudomonadota bacterium]